MIHTHQPFVTANVGRIQREGVRRKAFNQSSVSFTRHVCTPVLKQMTFNTAGK